jgi:hypothetical protein
VGGQLWFKWHQLHGGQDLGSRISIPWPRRS